MELPEVLAGPILRRVEPGRVCVWIAVSRPVTVTAEVMLLNGPLPVLGAAAATAVRLGERLWVHLAEVRPGAGPFPEDVLLAYDVVLTDDRGARRLADLGLLGGPDGLAYPGLPLPTFAIRQSNPVLRLLHGSCRLLHGKGDDAMRAADDLLARDPRDVDRRPCALMLTGDQIYGDDVAGPLARPLRALADALCGPGDATSVPGLPPLDEVAVYGRKPLAHDTAAFTSPKAHNHLFSFGEYAAMYCTAWNADVWPPAFPAATAALPAAGVLRRAKWEGERAGLERTRAGLPAVRRLLANVPTFMVFDDHDVTDDWNLTQGWRTRVWERPAGRRSIANAIAAFWAFQGWGNDPGTFDAAFRAQLAAHLHHAGDPAADGGEGGEGADAFDRTMWELHQWSFTLPTTPPVLVLDTRTQRAYDGPETAARLLEEAERARLVQRCRAAGHRPGDPLVVVSAVPVWGLELQERRQKALVTHLGPYAIDFEQWHSNLHGVLDLLEMLAVDLGLRRCVVLSGDVHYGLTVRGRFAVGDRRVEVAQLVSSSLQHGGEATRWALDAIGSVVTAEHHRVGWRRPPALKGHAAIADRLLHRAPNTDTWDEQSPVVMAPRHARRLGIAQAPDFRESRRYVRPDTRRASVVVGENNVGLVTVDGGRVTHQLLTRRRGETLVHTAVVDLG